MLVVVALLAVTALTQTSASETASGAETVARAMADAIRERFGASAIVDVTDVTTAVRVPPLVLNAIPDPDGRSGARVGFTLVVTRRAGGRPQAMRIGRASATVRVWPEQVRMRRFVARGMAVSATDVDLSRDEAVAVPLRRLPGLEEVIGGRALRDLPVDAAVTAGAVVLQPVVRAGDEVLVTARGPDFQVSATMKAVESGATGAVIHVLNRESRRTLRARIVSKGAVDILHD
jgi:flagella basal body P-ring formation protein FlgA